MEDRVKLDLFQLAEIANEVPMSAGQFFDKYLRRHEISHNAAAKQMGCAPSTVNRLANGGDLTVDMAVKINATFGLAIDGLFNYEASHKTFLAKQQVKTAT